MTRAREQARRLASARELVARHRDGHELSTDELAMAVEAGLLGELLSAIDAAPLWPSKHTTTTENNRRGPTDAKATSETRPVP